MVKIKPRTFTPVSQSRSGAVNKGIGVKVPVSDNGIRLTSTININSANRISGEFVEVYESSIGNRGKGSWFYLDHSLIGFNVEEASLNFISGVVFERIGTYRNQPVSAPGWTPTDHNFDFNLINSDCLLRDVVCLNATRGIRHDEGSAGRITIDGLKGQFFKVGIEICWSPAGG